MSEETKPLEEETSSVEKRLWRLTVASLVFEIVLSLFLTSWDFTIGICIGGSLAVLNFRMLQTSIRGTFQKQSNSFTVRFILRYFVIVLTIFLVSYFEIASIFGILLGISSFVIALMLEALIQIYFVITGREEI